MNKILILLFFITQLITSQNFDSKDWKWFDDEEVFYITISKSDTITLNTMKLIVDWNKKLNYSENIGYYGGINFLAIYINGELINTFNQIEDVTGLGEIYINLYDYNMDGYIDFSIPISSGKTLWRSYYFFNPELNKFENIDNWDYIDIQKINKKDKLILTYQDGNYEESNRVLYKIKGFNIEQLDLEKSNRF